MKILITGGAGFIGSHLAEKLLDEGHRVVVIDNFDDFYDPKEKRRNLIHCRSNPEFFLVEGDIRDEKKLKNVFNKDKIDVVVHLAAKTGVRPSIKHPQLYQETNIGGTLSLLEVVKDFKVKNFIFGSSSSVYGERSKVPFRENDRVDRPISPYGLSKVAGEQLCYVYHHLYGIPVTCFRFFTVYGPRQRPDMAIRKFIQAIDKGRQITTFGDGLSERDYSYIDDIVSGVLKAIPKNFGFEIVNLGNSTPIKLRELISLIEESLQKKAKIKKIPSQPGDVTRTFADVSRAKMLLGWRPKTKIKEGLAKMVAWYIHY